ncbi:RING finger protein 225-like isoform X2 [Vulpes lagopus]|uniref:RING finger protein 225-like isoform X2 n=1 Tax=Vulpes lagopus TaxID=494514 RepID=UPI001BC92722|nr:RING finger protein 225-like isoform X2 [Vulpes lagopus]
MDAQVYPCLPAKNTSIPHPCCRPERKESGQFLKTSRGVTTVPVGSNIHSAFVLDTSTVFLGHCRLHTETAIGGGTGSGGAGRTPLLPPQPAAQLAGLLQAKIPRGGGAPPAARCRTHTEKPVCGLGSPRLDDGMERPGRSSRRPPPPPPGAVAAHSPPIDPQLWNFIY